MSVRVGETLPAPMRCKRRQAMLGLGEIPRGPAIYLGSFETNLKDLTSAYTVFPNAGVRKQSYIIERIDDADHNPIYRAAHVTIPAIDPGAAWMTSQLMEQVMKSGTAASAKSLGFKLPAAGKTGTTNDYKDAWFLGYTSALTCGVWVGFDQPPTIMSRGYGVGPRAAGLDEHDAEGGAALSGEAIPADDAAGARDGLREFKPTRDERVSAGPGPARDRRAGRGAAVRGGPRAGGTGDRRPPRQRVRAGDRGLP